VPGPARLAIHDAQGKLVREFTNVAPPIDTAMPNVPEYWFKAPEVVRTTAGMHRFVWDLRYPTPPSLNYGADGNPASSTSYGIIAAAIVGQSPRQQPVGPLVLPGTYQVRLTVGGRTLTRELVVKNDPRVSITEQDLEAQLQAERGLAAGLAASRDAIEQIRSLRQAASERAVGASVPAPVKAAINAFEQAARGVIAGLAASRALAQHLAALEFADLTLTESTKAAIGAGCARADEALGRYRQLVQQDLMTLNAALRAAGLSVVPVPTVGIEKACAMK